LRWWLNRRRRTGGVSVSDTVDTTNGRRRNAGIAAARTAGRGRDEAQSLTATIWQRRPSDQLTPSHRPQLDGDARERQHVSPFTRQLRSTLSSAAAHTRGQQLVSSPVWQLRLTLSATQDLVRTLRRTHTRTHSPTISLTTTGLLSFTLSAQLLEFSSSYTVSRLHDNRLTVYQLNRTFLRRFLTISILRDYLSQLSVHSDSIASDTRWYGHAPACTVT